MDKVRESEGTLDLFDWSGRPSASIDLARVTPLKTFGGTGCEAVCDYCGTPVEKTDIEYEVDGELDGAPVTLHLHQRCHDACIGHTVAAPDLTSRPAPPP